jgi:hypothetical protein
MTSFNATREHEEKSMSMDQKPGTLKIKVATEIYGTASFTIPKWLRPSQSIYLCVDHLNSHLTDLRFRAGGKAAACGV